MRKCMRRAVVPILTAACMTFQTGTAWAVPTGPSQEVLTQGRWDFGDGIWRYYDSAGTARTGWLQTAGGWYYLDPGNGALRTGWQNIDGKLFYLNTAQDGVEGMMRTGWFQEPSGQRYFLNTASDGSQGSALTGWQWIDGYCYFFESAEGSEKGKMYAGKEAPGGFLTDAQGRWIEKDGSVHYEPGRGFSSADNTKAASTGGKSSGGRSSGSAGSGSGSAGSGNSGGSGSENTVKPGGDDLNGSGENTVDENTGDEGKSGELIDQDKTQFLNLGWIRYAVITFEDGTIDDYSVRIDGTDVTDTLTRVDDDGSVVKWESTVLKPGSVTVTRESDGRKQTVKLGSAAAATAPDAGGADNAPKAILTNGPVSRFDYYLDVYDKNGQVRVEPERTTFDLSDRRGSASEEIPSAYYVPDTLIDQETGNGEITVKLSLETKAQEEWFNEIKTIKALNQENSILNSELSFRKSTENAYGKTGVLKISLPQTNLFSRGRYQLNLVSGYSTATVTVPVHLVDNRTFTMKLNTLNLNPEPGECFAFTIEGEDGATFGNEILSPIYRVELTAPSGKTKELENITEWYEIGDMLHICGTNTKEETVTDESGIYTVTAYANGYKTMTKSVEIGSAVTIFGKRSGSSDYGADAISGASWNGSSGSSGESGSSGGGDMNAFLIFDHDLIVNALILEKIGMTNQAAEAVLERWESQSPVAVMDENADELFDFVTYLNAVKDAGMGDNAVLSFRRYAEIGKGQTENRPYQVKRVLEDGLLGSTFLFTEMTGKRAPQLEGLSGAFGEDLVLGCSTDPLYLNKNTRFYLDGSATELRNDSYLAGYMFDEDTGKAVIYSSTKGTAGGSIQLTAGVHELRIVSEGYQTAIAELNINKAQEQFDLSLSNPNPAAGEDAADASVYYTGQDVHVTAACGEDDGDQGVLRGDFMKNLKGIELRKPDGSSFKVTSNTEGSLSGDDNYVPGKFGFVLQKGLFKESGDYMVTVRADNYTPKTLEFRIEQGEEEQNPSETPATPEVDKVEKKSAFFYGKYYRVSFNADSEQALELYLKELENSTKTEIQVNGEKYTYSGLSVSESDQYRYTVSDNETNGGIQYLDLSINGFAAGKNTVTIEVEGCDDLSFDVFLDKNGDITEGEEQEPPAGLLTAPEVKKAELKSSILLGKYYRVTFEKATEEELEAYLNVLKNTDKTTIQVNGQEYTYSGSSISSDDVDRYKVSEDESYGILKYLDLSVNGFNTEEENAITIEAEGYDELSFEIYLDETGKVAKPEEDIDNSAVTPAPSEDVLPPSEEPGETDSKTEEDGNKPEVDNKEPEAGDQEPESGDQEPETGDQEPEAGDQKPETGDQKPETDDQKTESGDQEPETGDQEPETGDQEPETGDQEPETDDQKTKSGDQEPESGDQEPETGGQNQESGSKEPEAGDKAPEVSANEPEVSNKESEADAQDPEVSDKSKDLEAGNKGLK
ncbi:hemoblobin-interacting domain-containing protein [Clostridium transplantifaecale]|uniref:hemoblobin-interacting domain-containing protein n=1 Tax=Clostridium transplantifaecale TaxID=2479838 RepID=UPI001FA9CE73|nr:hemoblobin-interacting domain-containing protein [Clostridium transplantifaecale]